MRDADHFSAELLIDYLQMALPESEELAVEEHLADCAECSALARETQRFSSVWETWTAAAHGNAYRAAAVNRALAAAKARVADASWQGRLTRWAEGWAGAAAASVRVIVGTPGRASRALAEGLEGLSQAAAAPPPAFAPAPGPVRGAYGRAAEPAQPTVAVTSMGGVAQARVAVSGDRREVVVRIDELPGERLPPLILLVPLGTDDEEPRVTVPERQPSIPYLIARFADVPTGDYIVAFEPMEE
jgi:anti-sigma factor RsiW